MALALEILGDDGDPGYRLVGRHLPRRPHSVREWTSSFWAILLIAVVGLILGVALAQARARAPEVAAARAELLTRVATLEGQNRQLRGLIDDERLTLTDLQGALLTGDAAAESILARSTSLALTSGYRRAVGPGITVILRDPPSTAQLPPGADPSLARVLDADLQDVVNGLWAAGAEAITINTQRVAATTAIRQAGGAILVGYRPVLAPYRVRAIGGDDLAARFAEQPVTQQLTALGEDYGISVNVLPSTFLTMPGASVPSVVHARLYGDLAPAEPPGG